jgi:hypothetical protein
VSAPPFTLLFTDDASRVLTELQLPKYKAKRTKARKGLHLLRDVGPSHPGVNSHRYESLAGPQGEAVWESYLENQTPSAWRIWWIYGTESDTLTVITLGPHP